MENLNTNAIKVMVVRVCFVLLVAFIIYYAFTFL